MRFRLVPKPTTLDDINALCFKTHASFGDGFYWKTVSSIDVDKARVLLELRFFRSGMFHLLAFYIHSLTCCLCRC